MHQAYESWLSLFHWFTRDGAAHSTALLCFITAWYAFLTNQMSRAMSRQTKAMVQPIISLEVRVQDDEIYPKGSFIIRNVGVQPLILLHTELYCNNDGKHLTEVYELWDEHLLPPGGQLEPLFDFTGDFTRQGITGWTVGGQSYQLTVTATDLSKSVILTYSDIPVLAVSRVRSGLPFFVRWRYFKRSVTWKWNALKQLLARFSQ